MPDVSLLPLLGAVIVPLLLWWIKGNADKADKAQTDAHGELKARVTKLEDTLASKADKVDMKERLDKGSEKMDQFLDLLRSIERGIADMNTHLVTELAKRPTHEEVRAMFQQPRP